MEREIEVLDDVQARIELNKENPFAIICVYGTLRQGEGNHKACLAGTKSELLGTFKSEPKFTMYGRRAGFPVLTEGETSITYEAWKVTEPRVLERLHSLEGCTGIPGDPDNWYDIVPLNTPVGQGWIYLQHDYESMYGEEGIIKNGDWKSKSL